MAESFDDIREETAFQLGEDQYAAYLCAYIDDEGVAAADLARDGNRIPPGMSREEAAYALIVAALNRVFPQVTLAELVAQAGNIDVEAVPDAELGQPPE